MFGLEVRWIRHIPPSTAHIAAMRIVSSLRKFEIDLVLDVGANEGSSHQKYVIADMRVESCRSNLFRRHTVS